MTTVTSPQPLERTFSSRQLESLFANLLVFAIPALAFLQIQVVGRLFATDVLVLAALPFVLVARVRPLAAPLPRKLLALGVVWLVAQVITDLVRQTAFNDYARGWAKIAFFLASFVVLYILAHNRPRRLVLYGVGLVIGGVLTFYLSPGPYAEAEPWKFGVGGPVTLLLILLTSHRLVRWAFPLQLLMIGAAALVNLYMGFRALSGVCFLTAIYLMTGGFGGGRHHVSGRRVALFALLTLGAGLAFLAIYGYAAREGALGETAREKYESQAAGELGLLIGARGEILISARAITESPIIGHGSWARDPEYAELSLELRRALGYEVQPSDVVDAGLIPTHSYLFGAWVEAGLLGAAFWVWVLFVAFRALAKLGGRAGSLTPLILFAGFMLIWNVLFSPFGAEQRFLTAYCIVLLMHVLQPVPVEPSRV
jgi:hypothetical protein